MPYTFKMARLPKASCVAVVFMTFAVLAFMLSLQFVASLVYGAFMSSLLKVNLLPLSKVVSGFPFGFVVKRIYNDKRKGNNARRGSKHMSRSIAKAKYLSLVLIIIGLFLIIDSLFHHAISFDYSKLGFNWADEYFSHLYVGLPLVLMGLWGWRGE
ncbi:MAG: hypothetical protein L6N94_07365 [Candidatus Methylarchaceae archaeon HK01M]|nr:hypothetical protein [Candidatus Methylarchaceae archaeon HK01M]